MAVIGSTALTLADWAARRDDKGIAIIVDLLSQANEILDDMLWVEGNLTTGHKTTVTTSLPSGTWRPMNVGVARNKGTTAQLIATCGNLEAYSVMDKDLADLAGDTRRVPAEGGRLFFEGMSQQMAGQMFYGYARPRPRSSPASRPTTRRRRPATASRRRTSSTRAA